MEIAEALAAAARLEPWGLDRTNLESLLVAVGTVNGIVLLLQRVDEHNLTTNNCSSLEVNYSPVVVI